MPFHYPLNDRQPQTESAGIPAAARIQTHKGLEDTPAVCFGYSGSVVVHMDQAVMIPFINADIDATECMCGRVANQIDQCSGHEAWR